MKKGLLLIAALLFAFGATFAQSRTLLITYDATKGTSGLAGAAKVYMHSGVGTSAAGTAWETTIGNWGMDDGIGEMTSLGNDMWEIEVNLDDYYGLVGMPTVYGIGMVFRNADGTLEGKDKDNSDIFLRGVNTGDISVENSDGTAFDGVTVAYVFPAGIANLSTVGVTELSIPSNITAEGVVAFNLSGQSRDLEVSVFNLIGQQVAVLAQQSFNSGRHTLRWNAGDLRQGIYMVQVRALDSNARETRKVIVR